MKELRNTLRRFIMANLTAALILGSIPVSAFAAELPEAGIISDEDNVIMEVTDETLEVSPEIKEDTISDDVDDLKDDSLELVEDVLTADGEALEDEETVSEIIADGGVAETEWTETDSLPTETGNYILKSDITLSENWLTNKNIALNLNGHTIDRGFPNNTEWGFVIVVDDAGTLILRNTDTEKNGVITGGIRNSGGDDIGGGVHVHGKLIMGDGVTISGNRGPGVVMEPEATFTMTGGKIEKNMSDVPGAGVYVDEGTFTMTGGEIKDNYTEAWCGGVFVNDGKFTMTGGALITGNECKGGTGGGVFALSSNTVIGGNARITDNKAISGGGISVTGGTFAIGGNAQVENNTATYGGGISSFQANITLSENTTITGNKADSGAGVYNGREGRFTMTGGTINGNEASDCGAGVISYGEFIMDSGAITGNTCGEGGNVYLYSGSFTMNGGTINGNKAGWASGVQVDQTAEFEMNGGEISDNTSADFGSGVHVWGKFTMKDGAKITRNTASSNTVCIENKGQFTMKGGRIYDNIGNGVHVSGKIENDSVVNSGKFDMTGGAISGNTGSGIYIVKGGTVNISGDASITGNTYKYGGGILAYRSTIKMTGGSITGNTASERGGGGIYLGEDANFTMTGGSIIGNSSTNYMSGGIYCSPKCTFNISGNPVIRENYKGGTKSSAGLYEGISSNKADIFVSDKEPAINVIGELAEGADIYVCGREDMYVAQGVKPYTLKDSDVDKFTADYDKFHVTMKRGKAYIEVDPDAEKNHVKLKDGESVTLYNSTLTYGQPLSKLSFNKVEFVTDDKEESPVSGIVTWKDPQMIPDAGTTSAEWVFKPVYSKLFDTATGSVPITVNKADMPEVKASYGIKYGADSELDISEYVEKGGTASPAAPTGDPIFEVGPSLADTTKLSFTIKNDFKLVGKKAKIKIPVTGATNYNDYDIDITIEVLPDENYSSLIEEMKKNETDKDVQVSSNTTSEGGVSTTKISVGDKDVSTVTVDEDGKVKEETKIWVSGLADAYKYTGSAIKPDIVVHDGTRKLTKGTDYTLSYKNNKAVGTSAKIFVNYKGSYAGTAKTTVLFNIVAASLEDDVTAVPMSIAGNKKVQKPVPTLIMNSTGKKISVSKKYFDFIYRYSDDTDVLPGVKEADSYTVTIKPKTNNKSFTGSKTVNITVTDKTHLMSKVSVKLAPGQQKSYVYTGQPINPGSGRYVLTIKEGRKTITLSENDYEVEYTNNVNPGKALVTFTGKGDYKGTKTTTFKIVKGRTLSESNIALFDENVSFAKGGAKPDIVVKDGDKTLTAGKDYKITYSKNKAVTNGEKTAVAKVKGKGNYKGEIKLYYSIKKQNIETISGNIVVKDKVKSRNGDYRNPSVTITDLDGKKLKAGTDYKLDNEKSYIPGPEPDTMGVTIVGQGNYDGECRVFYHYIDSDKQLSKLKKGTNIPNQIYTGKPITLSDEVLNKLLYTGTKSAPDYLVNGRDFEVTYSKNVKKGTAKVILQGKGHFGGTRTFTFKIKAKKGSFLGTLTGGNWK